MTNNDTSSLRFTRDGSGIAVRQYRSGGPVLSLTMEELHAHIEAVKAGKLDYLFESVKKEKAPA